MMPVLASLDVDGVSVTVAAYGTFLVLAVVAALILGARAATGLGVGRGHAVAGLALAVLAGLVGARLLDVVLDVGSYASDPWRAIAPEPRGFALYGGFIGCVLAVGLAARAWRIPFARLADRAIPAVVAGLVLLRIGCFLNGCCAGVETALPWGVTFPTRDPLGGTVLGGLDSFGLGAVAADPAPVHPTQLYEIGAVLLCGGVAMVLARRRVPAGIPATAFAAGFLLFRAADQTLRVPAPGSSVPDWWLPIAYAAVGVATLAILAWRWRSVGTDPASPPGDEVAPRPRTGALGAPS
jgi:phosphatidylglycerol:prolipoprotein diacylglycerol transferase